MLYDWQKITRVLPLNPFGKGKDGDLTISSNSTYDPGYGWLNSASAGSITISGSFPVYPAGTIVLIHQARGTGVGNWEVNKVVSTSSGSITLSEPLQFSYTRDTNSIAHIMPIKQYRNITINSGVSWEIAYGFDHFYEGGIMPIVISDTLTIDGTIVGTNHGYRGGPGDASGTDSHGAYAGEGYPKDYVANSRYANGNGGGGGWKQSGQAGVSAGGGGGLGTAGANGGYENTSVISYGGSTAGNATLTSLVFGGGGGGGRKWGSSGSAGTGGTGGGIIMFFARNINIGGSILNKGTNGGSSTSNDRAGGAGGGSGGSVLLCGESVNIGTNKIDTRGGAGGTASAPNTATGGAGGKGRIAVYYGKSLSGSVSSTYYGTLNTQQDKDFMMPHFGGHLLLSL